MKIVVCIKQVPNTTRVTIDPVTHNLRREGLIGVMNPYDRNAIEEALRFREKNGGEVILLSMGPAENEKSLRDGLAMGADRAILLCSRAFAGSDTLATAYTLTQAIRKIGDVDLILLGKQAIDADTGQVGPIMAEFLHYPQVTYTRNITINDSNFVAERRMGTIVQRVEVDYPAVVTAHEDLNIPRYATPRNIQNAFRQDIVQWDETDIEADLGRIGLNGSPTVVESVFEPEEKSVETIYLTGTPEDAAKALLDSLKESNLIQVKRI